MGSREDFLSRWSRRKRETAASANEPKQSDREARAKSRDAPISQNTAVDRTVPAFDLAKLPSIESITAETDIRDFLAPFVPPELTRAALRRVWTTDLKIRDFVGLADYDWDFNTPGSMAGFGSLEPTDALRRQVVDLIGRGAGEGNDRVSKITEAEPISSGSVPDRPGPREPINDSLASPQNFDDPHSREATRRREATNATIDQREKPDELPLIGPRRHGKALPK
jgi:Protein of unknown function (DUF3306)